MNLRQNLNRIEKLHALILARRTCAPKELAERLGISRATLYKLIDDLSSLDLPIEYSRKHETFFYKKEVNQTISFKVETIDEPEELKKINGGNLTFSAPSNFSDGRNIPLYPYFANTKSQAAGF